MTVIKGTLLKTSNKIILGLIALLGFTLTFCRKEYGCPSAKFIVYGKAESKDSVFPVKNIMVAMNGDTTFTSNEGQFMVIKNDYPPDDVIFNLSFKDIDSTVNGEFKELDTIVEFINPQFVNGDGDWYEGEASKEFNVRLERK